MALRTRLQVPRSTRFWAPSPDDPIPGPSSGKEEKTTPPGAAAGVARLVCVAASRLVPVGESEPPPLSMGCADRALHTAFAHLLGSTNPCPIAVHMEPFSTSALKDLA